MTMRRGFTVYEVLVAIALVVVVAAVALPYAWTWAKGEEFEEARNQVEAALAMARADAQREGKPVRVAARQDPLTGAWCVYSERIDPMGEVESGPAASALTLPKGLTVGAGNGESAAARGDAAATEPKRAEGAGTGMGVGTASVEGRGAGDSGWVEAEEGEGLAGIVVATFMPDGEAVGARPWFMRGANGKAFEVAIDAWTGRVTMRPVVAAAAETGE